MSCWRSKMIIALKEYFRTIRDIIEIYLNEHIVLGLLVTYASIFIPYTLLLYLGAKLADYLEDS